MFTGIIETTGIVKDLNRSGGNLELTISSSISAELKIDQSVSHNGVCLTITANDSGSHKVTAIEETLNKSMLGDLKVGDNVNLERALKADSRIDGHIVQGHVDITGTCKTVRVLDGSHEVTIIHPEGDDFLTVEKGSVCLNGVSLTVYDCTPSSFKVALIPYTFNHTGFRHIMQGDKVNIEFDILGKYVKRLVGNQVHQ